MAQKHPAPRQNAIKRRNEIVAASGVYTYTLVSALIGCSLAVGNLRHWRGNLGLLQDPDHLFRIEVLLHPMPLSEQLEKTNIHTIQSRTTGCYRQQVGFVVARAVKRCGSSGSDTGLKAQ